MGLLDQIFCQCSFGMAVKAVREGSAFWGIWAMVGKVVCRESMTCLVLGGRSLGLVCAKTVEIKVPAGVEWAEPRWCVTLRAKWTRQCCQAAPGRMALTALRIPIHRVVGLWWWGTPTPHTPARKQKHNKKQRGCGETQTLLDFPATSSGFGVRRCPTLPHTRVCSTIGAGRLNYRVRDGTGCFPSAMTTDTTLYTILPFTPQLQQQAGGGLASPPPRREGGGGGCVLRHSIVDASTQKSCVHKQ